MSRGLFYAVGVGPGNPKLMTYAAVEVIENCHVLVLPISDKTLKEPAKEQGKGELFARYATGCVAFTIASGLISGLDEKEILYLPMPMIKDENKLRAIHDLDARSLHTLLDAGKTCAFITLGDPSVYSTCLYIQKRLKESGYETALVPGIASFLACAAVLNRGLVENRQMLHVVPGSYGVEEALALPGVKVLMKAGRTMPAVKEALRRAQARVYMVENCGMANEQIYKGTDEIPDDAGYYSLIIVEPA